MVSFPSELADWIQPGAIGAAFAVVWAEIRSLHRRVDEVREDMKEGFAQVREEMKEGFAQSRADVRALNEKLDRFVEASLAAK